MSTSIFRKKINFIYTDTQQYIILECLKSETTSTLTFHNGDGTKQKINGSDSNDGKIKGNKILCTVNETVPMWVPM